MTLVSNALRSIKLYMYYNKAASCVWIEAGRCHFSVSVDIRERREALYCFAMLSCVLFLFWNKCFYLELGKHSHFMSPVHWGPNSLPLMSLDSPLWFLLLIGEKQGINSDYYNWFHTFALMLPFVVLKCHIFHEVQFTLCIVESCEFQQTHTTV